jgi:hypothetical protein
MNPGKRIHLVLLFAFILLPLFLVVHASSNTYATREREQIGPRHVVGTVIEEDGSKVTYFSDGTKNIEVFPSLTIRVTTTTSTVSTTIMQPTPNIDIIGILQIVNLLVAIISDTLGILGISVYIGSKKKPEYVATAIKTSD